MVTQDNNKLDDFDLNEWGNTNSDILNPKWNYKNAAKERMANPATRKKLSESISKKQNEKEYLEHMSRQRLESMDKPVDDSGMTLREKLTQANRKSAVDPIAHANRTKANRRMRKDPKWIAAQKKGCWDAYGYTVTTPKGEYPAMYEFDRAHNLRKGTCANLVKGLPHLFYKTQDGPGQKTYERIIHTSYGWFQSIPEAYKFAQEQGDQQALKLKNVEGWFLKMCVFFPKQFFIKFQIAKYWPMEKDAPYGNTDKKPRYSKNRMLSLKEAWEKRLSYQRSIYKELKNT
jgi:hypothetical protein